MTNIHYNKNDNNKNQSSCFDLSVIIPFRADEHLPYLMDRLEDQCKGFRKYKNIEFILVDSGSNDKNQEQCIRICKDYGIKYLNHNSHGKVFSIGAARDYGVCHALGRAITFLDVDLRVADDFFDRLLLLMSSYGISTHKKRFFAIPCLYLTSEGTDEFIVTETQSRMYDFYLRWLHGDTQSIQTMAPCSSVMIVDRLHYMSVGGHRPEFRGHGYEDFELYHRLIGEEGIMPTAEDYYADTKSWDTATYRGFRSQFSLLGRAALMANLFVVHLWHPRPKKSSFYGNMSVNREIWMDFFKEFDKTKEHPEPLIDQFAKYKKILAFGQPQTNSMRAPRDLIPLLGQRVYANEFDFTDESGTLDEIAFQSMLVSSQIQAILFPNPYSNPVRLQVYQWCRRTQFPFLVYERGALPDSWFIDENGFNADSDSYQRKNWDRKLTDVERDSVKKYINQTLIGGNPLEPQGQRFGGEGLSYRLKLGGKKVLFVPLQRPSDTVIKYMRGDLESYSKFTSFIDEAAKELKKLGWIVLCKKHPLEVESPPLKNAIYAPEDANFIDLLELADSVALINSGVGLYAMMMGKPCFIFGNAFYAFEGINTKSSTESISDFCDLILSENPIDSESTYRFINFLMNDFYSFGTSKVTLRKESDGSLRSITTATNFYQIQTLNGGKINYRNEPGKSITTAAPLFERFKLDVHNKKKQNEQKKHAVTSFKTKETKNKSAVKNGIVNNIHPKKTAPKDLMAAKKAKLIRDPHAFFRDSRFVVLKPLRHFWSATDR